MKFSDLLLRWDRFMWAPTSPLNMGLLRIMWGILALTSTLMLLPERYMWFGHNAVWTIENAHQELGFNHLDLMSRWVTTDTAIDQWFGVFVVFALLATFGVLSRFTTFVVWVMYTSMCHRNNMILHSGDTLLRITGFFLIFAPIGDCVSFDAWWRNRKTGASILSAPAKPHAVQRILQIQLCIVYFTTAWWKLLGPEWNQGTAVGYVLNLLEFQRFPLPDFMRGLVMSKFLTGFTAVVEVLFPLFVWFKDTRALTLLIGLSLHMGLEYCMNVQLFQPIICSLYILFVDPSDLERALRYVSDKFGRKLLSKSVSNQETDPRPMPG